VAGDGGGADWGRYRALGEGIVFLDYFKDLPDPRQRAKVLYPLDEVLFLCLLAVLAGSEAITDIARFGEKKLDLLRRFRPFRDGTPSHDHLGDILATLDAEQFQSCFAALAALTGVPADIIAIDGKTSRGSYQKKGANAPIHMVSAFAARQRLVLGQVKVAEKSNERRHPGTAQHVGDRGCDRDHRRHGLPARHRREDCGQEGRLRSRAQRQPRHPSRRHRAFRGGAEGERLHGRQGQSARNVDGDHGRIETRTYTAFHDVPWLQERHDWPGLKGFVMVESTREIGDKVERETRFYITSLVWLASQLGPVIRAHWRLKTAYIRSWTWIFRDDECRLRTDHSPVNFTTIKHMALNLIRRTPGRDSFRLKRKFAVWDDEFLASLIAA
jgi:predicted transposase YbfD/YdcC